MWEVLEVSRERQYWFLPLDLGETMERMRELKEEMGVGFCLGVEESNNWFYRVWVLGGERLFLIIINYFLKYYWCENWWELQILQAGFHEVWKKIQILVRGFSFYMYTCLKIYLYKLKIRLYKFSNKFIGY